MLLSEFDFPFDASLIADHPVEPRDQARLLVLSRGGGGPLNRHVLDIPDLLSPGDLLVVNDTKVVPARIFGRKRTTGGRVDILFVKEVGTGIWEVLLKGGVRSGQVIDLGGESQATVMERNRSKTTLRITGPAAVPELLRTVGVMPLPPYIKRRPEESDRQWYQTIFARDEGAIAAPTAGLHLSERLLHALRERGIHVAAVTLHVGPGTFQPVKTTCIEEHRMGAERFEVSPRVAELVRQAKADGGRVVAVGTTVVRSLEAAADPRQVVKPLKGETEMFIVPGYRFQVVDALITNFHLPRTTLLMLVSAFAGLERLQEAYGLAVREKYRFYSYGDAMLIL